MGPSPVPALTVRFTHAGLSQHCGLNVSLMNSCAGTQVYCDSAERPHAFHPPTTQAAPC